MIQVARSTKLLALFSFLAWSNYAVAVEIFFSPGTDCENRLVEAISSATHEIHAAVYTINNPRIVHSLVSAALRGVDVQILTDRRQAGAPDSRILDLANAGVHVHVRKKGGLEHNAFAVFDETEATTGSFNWTAAASETNSENCIFLRESSAVSTYQQRFLFLWKLGSTLGSSD